MRGNVPDYHDGAVPLESCRNNAQAGLMETLRARVEVVPFNLVASIIFVLAI